jgi:hypothetical protein
VYRTVPPDDSPMVDDVAEHSARMTWLTWAGYVDEEISLSVPRLAASLTGKIRARDSGRPNQAFGRPIWSARDRYVAAHQLPGRAWLCFVSRATTQPPDAELFCDLTPSGAHEAALAIAAFLAS